MVTLTTILERTMTLNYQVLRQALLDKKPCFAIYDGLERYICPHVIGSKAFMEQVLCWQYAGQSSSPLPPQGQWKCLSIAKMSNVRVLDSEWHYGEAGKTGRPTTCVDSIDVQIPL